MSSDLHYAPLGRETVDQALVEKGVLLEVAMALEYIDRLLARHPDIEEVSTQQVMEDVNRQIDLRARAIAEYCDPPQDEPENAWVQNLGGDRF